MDRIHDAGAGVTITVSLPIGIGASISNFPQFGFGWNAVPLYFWPLVLACLSSTAGAFAWNIATRRLPMVITGQLISIETTFAALLGLLAQQRLPSWDEFLGVVLVVLGAVLTVRTLFTRPEPLQGTSQPSSRIDAEACAFPPAQARTVRTLGECRMDCSPASCQAKTLRAIIVPVVSPNVRCRLGNLLA